MLNNRAQVQEKIMPAEDERQTSRNLSLLFGGIGGVGAIIGTGFVLLFITFGTGGHWGKAAGPGREEQIVMLLTGTILVMMGASAGYILGRLAIFLPKLAIIPVGVCSFVIAFFIGFFLFTPLGFGSVFPQYFLQFGFSIGELIFGW